MVDVFSFIDKNVIMKMEPDVLGYNQEKKILYIGEITLSAYLGSSAKKEINRKTHVGLNRKFSDCFTKLFLIQTIIEENKDSIFKNKIKINKIEKCFITLEGSISILSGWRKELTKSHIHDEIISLSKKDKKIIIDELQKSKDEKE